jgi:hydroxyethylthiazole kinase-like sugar kinase family protein
VKIPEPVKAKKIKRKNKLLLITYQKRKMKKIVALGTMLSFVVGSVFAQKYDTYKNYALLNQFKKGKEEFDKKKGDEKFMSKPEAYILQNALYVGNALDSTQAAQAPAYINDAFAAFQKYLSL